MSENPSATPLTVLLGNYPHTRPLKDGTVPVAGVECRHLESSPLPPAFARMVRELAYDISEMPMATYLQAREAGIPLTLLPVVLVGSTHHRSLTRLPEGPELSPGDLVGRRVGVRAYGQTTGLWVRGWLQEEYGVKSSDITWVTTEDVHVSQYVNPPYVQRSAAERVGDLLRSGDVSAAVLGPKAIGGQGAGLVPLVADAEDAGQAWIQRHGTIPANHLLVVRDDVLRERPDAVLAVYRALKQAIADTADQRDDSPAGRAVTAGWSPSLTACLEIAGRYALEQDLIGQPVDVAAIEHETAFLDT
ncbi:ABC transporter substrate-binding protein [Streptomyces sp. NPDC101225]|uniref:ABC transporter substrate-binding protein n=1 Tax=Streptomyces sp. NPDC101225 TaxID=3366135 RepID=UPI00382D299C